MVIRTIYTGNSLDVLKTLPNQSVQMCVTSPPYYGLRDYGTGQWVGGDPNCDHKNADVQQRFDYAMGKSGKQKTNVGTDFRFHKKVCPDCGAVREDKQIGLEQTPQEYIDNLVAVFREVRRVLKQERRYRS